MTNSGPSRMRRGERGECGTQDADCTSGWAGKFFDKLFGFPVKPGVLEWVTVCMVVAHILLIIWHFPLRFLLTGQPLCAGDLGFHFAHSFEGSEVLRGWRLWGYSPYVMAGYPFGTWNSVGGFRGYEYASLLLPMLSLPAAFYLYVVGTAILPPFLIALAGRLMQLKRRGVLLCLCGAILLYQADSTVSYFWGFGNIAFPLVNSLCVLYTALLISSVERRSFWRATVAGLVLGLVGLLHQLVIVPALIASLSVLWIYRRELVCRWGLLIPVTAALVGGALFLPWAFVLHRFQSCRMTCRIPALESGWKYLVMDLLSDRMYRHAFDRRVLLHVFLVLAVAGTFWREQAGRRRILAMFWASVAILLCAYGFEYSAVMKQTQPYRYVISFLMFSIIPATFGAKLVFDRFLGANSAGRTLVACMGLILLPALTGYVFDILQNEPVHGLSQQAEPVVEWLRHNGHKEGRVLCEDQQMADLLPYYTRQEVIGGAASTQGSVLHSLSSVSPWDFFGKPLEKVSSEDFNAYMSAYNIGFAVTATASLSMKYDRSAGWSLAFRSGRYRVWARDRSCLSYVEGRSATNSARVEASANSIRILCAPPGRFLLRYHFLETLRGPSSIRLRPVFLLDDPVPFIGIDNPEGLAMIELRNL